MDIELSKLKLYFISLIFVISCILFANGLSLILLSQEIFFPNDLSKFNSFHFFGLVVLQAFIFVSLCIFFMKYYKLSFFPFLVKPVSENLRPMLIFYSLFGLIMVDVFVIGIIYYLELDIEQFETMDVAKLRQNPVFFFVSVGLIAPLYEEFIFRGFLLKNLLNSPSKNSRISRISAVLFTSLLFSILHFEKYATLPLFILALYFSWVTLQTKSIFIPTLLHSLHNFVSGFAFLYAKN